MKRFKPLVSVALIAHFLLIGCSGTVVKDRYFRLSPIPPATDLATGTATVSEVLKMGAFSAKGLLNNERKLLIRSGENELSWKENIIWEELPSEMLSSLLTQALRDAGIFEQVVAKQVNVRTRYQLSGTLLMFEFDEQRSRAFVDIDVWLSDLDHRKIVFAKRYQLNSLAADNTPEAIVMAFNQTVIQLSTTVIEDVDQRF